MPFYLVRYTIGKNNEYVYPGGVTGVVWKTNIYNPVKMAMVGETDDEVSVDEKNVVALKPTKAKKLIKKYCTGSPAAAVPG